MFDLTEHDYDIVGSIVLYKTAEDEVQRAIRQFLAVPLRTYLCIIDNSPTPSIMDVPRENVGYYHAGTNLGYGRAHNLALRAARHKAAYSLVMNTDVVYAEDAVLKLRRYLENRPESGLAAPQLLNADGTIQHVCRLLPTPPNLILRRFLPASRWTKQSDDDYELRFWDHQSYANLPYYQGSFLMLRTELANALGGFDERFFMYGEDIDLCRRVYEVAEATYVPEAKVIHDYRRYSNHSLRGTWVGIQNNARYFNKWGWFFDGRRKEINRAVRAQLANAGANADADEVETSAKPAPLQSLRKRVPTIPAPRTLGVSSRDPTRAE